MDLLAAVPIIKGLPDRLIDDLCTLNDNEVRDLMEIAKVKTLDNQIRN